MANPADYPDLPRREPGSHWRRGIPREFPGDIRTRIFTDVGDGPRWYRNTHVDAVTHSMLRLLVRNAGREHEYPPEKIRELWTSFQGEEAHDPVPPSYLDATLAPVVPVIEQIDFGAIKSTHTEMMFRLVAAFDAAKARQWGSCRAELSGMAVQLNELLYLHGDVEFGEAFDTTPLIEQLRRHLDRNF